MLMSPDIVTRRERKERKRNKERKTERERERERKRERERERKREREREREKREREKRERERERDCDAPSLGSARLDGVSSRGEIPVISVISITSIIKVLAWLPLRRRLRECERVRYEDESENEDVTRYYRTPNARNDWNATNAADLRIRMVERRDACLVNHMPEFLHRVHVGLGPGKRRRGGDGRQT